MERPSHYFEDEEETNDTTPVKEVTIDVLHNPNTVVKGQLEASELLEIFEETDLWSLLIKLMRLNGEGILDGISEQEKKDTKEAIILLDKFKKDLNDVFHNLSCTDDEFHQKQITNSMLK